MPVVDGTYSKSAYVGLVRAACAEVISKPRMVKADGTVRGLLYCHGAGGFARSLWDDHLSTTAPPTWGNTFSSRYFVYSGDWAANSLAWGSNNAVDDMLGASNLLDTLGASSTLGKIVAAGSMGGLQSIRYAAKNPTKVAGLVLTIPALDLNEIRANVPSARTDQDTAWGVTYAVTPVIPEPSAPYPSIVMLTLAAQIQCPVFLSIDNNDPLVSFTTAQNFAAAVNANAYPAAQVTFQNVGALGHTSAAVDASNVAMEAWLSTNFPQDIISPP